MSTYEDEIRRRLRPGATDVEKLAAAVDVAMGLSDKYRELAERLTATLEGVATVGYRDNGVIIFSPMEVSGDLIELLETALAFSEAQAVVAAAKARIKLQ